MRTPPTRRKKPNPGGVVPPHPLLIQAFPEGFSTWGSTKVRALLGRQGASSTPLSTDYSLHHSVLFDEHEKSLCLMSEKIPCYQISRSSIWQSDAPTRQIRAGIQGWPSTKTSAMSSGFL
jgi:hypothetical protein